MGRKRRADDEAADDSETGDGAPPRAQGRSKPARNPSRGGGRSSRWKAVLQNFLFGREVDEETGTRLREIRGLLIIGMSLFLLVSMVSYYAPFGDPGAKGWNWGGQIGFYLANGAYMALGYAAYFAILVAFGWGCTMVAGRAVPLVGLRTLGGICFATSTAFLLHFAFGPDLEEARNGMSSRLPYGPGGWPALQLTPALLEKFGGPGLLIILVVTAFVSFLLATEMAFYPAWQAFQEWLRARREQRGESLASAVGGYLKRTGVGLWNFVRGADLAAGRMVAAPAGAAPGAVGAPELDEAGYEEAGHEAVDDGAEDDDDSDLDLEDEAEEEEDSDGFVHPRTAQPVKEPVLHRIMRPAKTPSLENPDRLPEVDEDDVEEAIEDELDEDMEFGTEPTAEELEALIAAEKAALDAEDADDEAAEDDEADGSDDEAGSAPSKELVPVAAAAAAWKTAPVKTRTADVPFDPPTPPPGPWTFPPLDLLLPPEGTAGVDDAFLQSSATKLEHALRSFKVEAQVVAAQVGPAVTLFELTVAQGTRMNKVTQLSQEIAAALRAQSVRVIAPIPGRETVGIEVPNTRRRVVRISELVSQKAYDPKIMSLPLFVGMDAEGGPVVEDLARMPHLLIAGTTGSGKSVCINTILASLLLTRSPHDVKMILLDPKMVELQAFANVPHLMCPVVTDVRQATSVLLWAVEKMEGRYELFKAAGVKNIKGYNALTEEQLKAQMGEEWNDERTPRHLPYIVIVVDEFADLMAASKKEAEHAITRLAQKSRAAGLHVIVATQRPSTDVITGVIKGNLPTRIAFQVASKVDSRVILDEMGADKLLGHGDMLFLPPGGAKLKRVQGALVEDSEVTKIVDFVCRESAPTFSQELVQVASGEARPTSEGGEASGEEDEMFDEAVRVILKSKRGSASLLQRALGIGYTRASRLIDIMTERGIVGPYRGSKVREIMITLDQWEEMHGPSPTTSAKGGVQHEAAGQGASDE
jgi:DNA segregation ATPase FtsK/SpoIIIE-like protein